MRVKNFLRLEMTMSELPKKEVFARERDFCTIKELSERIGKCYRTVHRAAQAGKIKTIRFGASRLIPRTEVERILQRGF
jgi:excisionase family DNA binding protein